MNRSLPAILAVAVAVLLQVGLAPYIAIGTAVPNFLLIVVVTLAFVKGPGAGAISGFAAGLIYDLLGVSPVGVMALVLAVTGYFAGLLFAQMFAEGWLLPLTVLGVAALLSSIAYGVILQILGADVSFAEAFLYVMLPGAVYNTTLALLVYPWLARFLRRERPVQTFRRIG